MKVHHSILEEHHGQQREVIGGVAKVLIETGHQRGEEERIGDLAHQVSQLMSKSFVTLAEFIDGGVVLVKTKELLLKEDDAQQPIVSEEAGDFGQHRTRGVAVAKDDVKNLLGDGEEESPDDGGVDGHPLNH